jgi:SAM-dependent methyltransferase
VCSISDFRGLSLDDYHRHILERELSMWHLYYLPSKSLVGKTVLDLGAGCGETAQFFLNHGASRVVCVEPNSTWLEYLQKNFGNDPRVEIVSDFIDHIKMDIEGGEEGMIFEAHFPLKIRKLSGSPRETLWRIEKRRGFWGALLVRVGPRAYRLIRDSPFERVAKRIRDLVG